MTVSAGSAGSSTITVTPKNGYTGTIGWSVSASASLSNTCYSISNTTISGSSAVTATLTIDTSASACSSSSIKGTNVKRKLLSVVSTIPDDNERPLSGSLAAHATAALAGMLFAIAFGYRPRKPCRLGGVFLMVLVGLALAGCGSSSSSSDATKGTYTLTITGTDTSSSIAATTTMTLTID